MEKRKAIVAMSGGVDSSVAAALLKEQGYEVAGVTMTIWSGGAAPEMTRRGCYGPEDEDIQDARKVAERLQIPLHIFDLAHEYRVQVLDYVRQEYLRGRTPNPCVRCNRLIKLDRLISKARAAGIEFSCVGTGHYARVEKSAQNRRYLLKKAKDIRKDQSYFLFNLSQEQLGRSLFPLGEYSKNEVRQLAAKFGLTVRDKPESQDFVTGSYTSALGIEPHPGPVLDTDGRRLGEHRGIPFYTIGQRKGLGIAAGKPLYVVDLDRDNNAVTVGLKERLLRNELTCCELNWIAIDSLEGPITAQAKIRYSLYEAEAVITPLPEQRAHVKFAEPQMAVTPGQSIVFYRGDLVLGGGLIE